MGSNAPPGRTCRSSTRKVRRARPFAAPPRPRPPYMSWGEFCPPVCAPARPRARSAACGGPAVAIVGPHRSLSEPPKAAGDVCRYLGQFWSFSLVFSSRCWHSGSSRRRDAREGDRGHTGAATAPPVASGQSLSGRAGPPKIQSTPTARGRRFGADLAAFRRGRDEYGPPPPKIHPRKGRGPRVAPLSGTPAAPVRAARWRGTNNSRPRFSRAAAPSRSAAASHLGAAGSCTWCAVESAGVQGVPRLVPARGGRRER